MVYQLVLFKKIGRLERSIETRDDMHMKTNLVLRAAEE